MARACYAGRVMARQPYPLEALRKLKDERTDEQARLLSAQVAQTQAAVAKLRERESARAEHAARLREVAQQEQERLARGEVSGGDLQRSVDFQQAGRVQQELLSRAVSEAQNALEHARELEQKLREELASREAEAKLVRNHEAGFHARQEARTQKADEEAALDQWNAKRR